MFNIHDSDKSSYAGSEYTYWAQIQRHTLKHVDNFYGAGIYTIAGLIDIGPEMVKIWILDFEKKILARIIADYVYFHMVYHTFIWNHCGCHSRVLNMAHFQLFPWFIQTLLVRKMGKNSKLFIWHTFAPKNNFQWSSWVLLMSQYQIFRGTLRSG